MNLTKEVVANIIENITRVKISYVLVVLTVINIPYLRYPQKEWHTTTRDVEWMTELPFQRTNSHEEVQFAFHLFTFLFLKKI